ncbi:TPA: hypothetical protein NKA88_004304 [Vibrio parahaemolyticus]|uniref:Uncharacterized protein n=1 Tax=Vibrio aestuarianus TaxID=28171 RepID=A0A9X4IUH5_9VIBR|nr:MULTISPECIES: hypothetical protein [Vibrio]EGQ8527426.1 hypothetical protein [Vibrio parahaemolyticus]EGQ9788831.1 hypothetical protein [Vibrio parahaemolyticus]EGQ9926086.1 hypothetical protein [Vibrio parahaemolyticus]EGR0120642.1 hypothetical protein [Vibrio parahaemolyticus]EGR0223622.1 hypothetical protein [Vibrio parahaemolyticus]
MIKIKNIHEHCTLDDLSISHHDVVFHGREVDIRTKEILNKITKECNENTFFVKYNKDTFRLKIGNEDVSPRKLEEFFSTKMYNSVFIEATSLDLPEIIYIFSGITLSKSSCNITISYLEPDDYQRSTNTSDSKQSGIQEQEFNLSDNQGNFGYLPLFAVNNSQMSKSTLVTTLGFESSRLGQLLAQDDGYAYERIEAYVGLPAYKPGWENRSIYKHMRYLSPDSAELKLFPACNPYEFTKQLSKLTRRGQKKQLVFAPMGTKPAVIAISTFLVNECLGQDKNSNFGALYDFPEKSQNRSTGVGKIYSYDLESKDNE